MPDQPPFFIVGCPRSGTTLLQILIDSHPAIAIPPESFIFDRFGPLLKSYGPLTEPGARRALAADLLTDRRILDWALDLSVDDLLARVKQLSAGGLFDALFSTYAESQRKSRWGDKTPQHALCIPALLEVFPDARIIHLVRDGRDVAESTARIAIGPCSILAIARRWQRYMDTVREQTAPLPSSQFLQIRFEDLVRDPVGIRSRILAFIGEDAALCPAIDQDLPKTGTLERSSTYAHHASLRKAISTSKIGIYTSAFTPRQIELFESVAGQGLAAHRYVLDFEKPRPPSWLEQAKAFLQDNTLRYLRKFRQPGALRQVTLELALAWQKISRIRSRRHVP
jgi:hypothetical protein